MVRGHEAGDLVIQSLGNILKRFSRESDIACRFGGEEFVVLLPDINLDDALDYAAKLHEQIGALHLRYQGKALGPITLSIGVAMYPEHGSTQEELIHQADIALYAAKNQGRNRTVTATILPKN